MQWNKLGLAIAVLSTGPVWAQDSTRTDEIESARAKKEQKLSSPRDPGLERAIGGIQGSWAYRFLTSTDGLGLGFGEMIPGAGFSTGPRYSKTLLDGRLRLTGYLRSSTKRYYTGGIQGSLTHLWNGHAALDFSADHFDYPQMPYYGPGSESRKTGRSDYRLEKTETQIHPALRPVKGLTLGLLGGFQAINVGPGTASEYISSDHQYTPAQAPGIEQQTDYLTGGGFVQFDWRDRPGDPTEGGKYRAEYTKFSDLDAGRYSFYQLNLDASEYIPFFNGKRVIALHGRTSLSDTRNSQQIPFYMQPTLGGADDLRGYRPFRFYDDNSVLVQAEYRWEASGVVELALFADGGNVFHDWSQWNLRHLETDYGFGIRFKGDTGVHFRLDTGVSHEGFQIWFRVNNPF
jgi:hypothetical protein